jgi:hypothetical protein
MPTAAVSTAIAAPIVAVSNVLLLMIAGPRRTRPGFGLALRKKVKLASWRNLLETAVLTGEPGWDRTNDLLIKSQLLYH